MRGSSQQTILTMYDGLPRPSLFRSALEGQPTYAHDSTTYPGHSFARRGRGRTDVGGHGQPLGGPGGKVTFITLSAADTDACSLDPRVRRVGLDVMRHSYSKWQAVRNNIRRARRLRAALRDANGDCVISFTGQMNVLTLLAARGLQQRIVICERVDPRQHAIGSWWSYSAAERTGNARVWSCKRKACGNFFGV